MSSFHSNHSTFVRAGAVVIAAVATSCVDTTRTSSRTPGTDASQSNIDPDAHAGVSTDAAPNDAGSSSAAPNPMTAPSTLAVETAPPTSYEYQNVAIGGGGFVPGVRFHPTEPNLLYAYTDISGLFRWDDDRWTPLLDWVGYDLPDLMGIESLAFDPGDPDRLYLAAGMYAQSFAPLASILRSDDRGETWEVLPAPFRVGGNEDGRGTGERMLVDPGSSDTLFYGARQGGLFKSTDRGEHWDVVETFPDVTDARMGIGVLFFDSTGETLYAGIQRASDNLYRSEDGGESWVAVEGAPEGLWPHRVAVAGDVAVLTYKDGPGPYAAYEGAVFAFEQSSGAFRDVTPYPGELGFGYGGVGIDPEDSDTMLVATLNRYVPHEEILRSTDGGESWTPLAAASRWDKAGAPFLGSASGYYDLHWMVDLAIDPFNPATALVVTGAGLWRGEDLDAFDAHPVADAGVGDAGVSDRAPTWTFFNRGLENTVVEALVSPAAGDGHLVTVMGDVGGFWHADLDTPPLERHQNPQGQAHQALDFAGGEPGLMVRVGHDYWGEGGLVAGFSEDSGETWEGFRWIPGGVLARRSTVALAADGSRVLWLAPGGDGYFTDDRGETWEQSTGLPPFNGIDTTWTNPDPKVAADRVDPSLFYAFDVLGGTLYVSHDGGQSFDASVTSLAKHPDYLARWANILTVSGHEGELWLTMTDGLYRSVDRGQSLAKYAGFTVAYGVGTGKPAAGSEYPTLFVVGALGEEIGLWRSSDEGRTWSRINTDAQQFGGFDLVTGDPRIEGRVYLGSQGRGVFYGDPE